MSTDRFGIDEALQEQLGQLGQEARSASGKIESEIDGRRRRQRNVAYGASALIQQSEDEIEGLQEELGQMEDIRDRAERLLGSAQPPEQPAPPASEPPEASVPPAEPTAAAPSSAPFDQDAPDNRPPSTWSAGQDGTAPQPAVVEGNRTNVFIVFVNWVRDFTLLQWLLAVIGALIGFRIGLATDDFGDATGTGRTIIQVVWVTGLTILGFGLGGLIGSWFGRRGNAT